MASPFIVLPAPGVGKVNRLISVMWRYNYGTTNDTGSNLVIFYPNGTSGFISTSNILLKRSPKSICNIQTLFLWIHS